VKRPLLDFLDYRISRLHIEPEPSFVPAEPQRAKIQTSFGVGRDPDAKQRFEVTLNARIYKEGADDNVGYAVDYTISGIFWSNLFLTSRGVPVTIVVNALTQLYGVSRGVVGQATAGGINDRFILPSVTFDDLVKKGADDPASNIITDTDHNDLAAKEGKSENEMSHTGHAGDLQRARSSSMPPLELVARLHGVLLSILKFDNTEVRPRIDAAAAQTAAEQCTIGTYLRTLANVRTLVTLKDSSSFQAIAMIARALFEFAVDIRLQQHIPDGAEKAMAFVDVEKLRAARRFVANAAKTGDECDIHEKFIKERSAEIEAKWQTYWPGQKRPPHWSGMNLRSRVQLLKTPFDAMYDAHYQELSWYVHTGLTGVANLEAQIFPLICGTSYEVAIESYRETLRAVIEQLNLRATDTDIEKKLELARLLPFTNGPGEAVQLRHEVLGY